MNYRSRGCDNTTINIIVKSHKKDFILYFYGSVTPFNNNGTVYFQTP